MSFFVGKFLKITALIAFGVDINVSAFDDDFTEARSGDDINDVFITVIISFAPCRAMRQIGGKAEEFPAGAGYTVVLESSDPSWFFICSDDFIPYVVDVPYAFYAPFFLWR